VRTRDLRDLTVALTAGLPLEEAKRLVAVAQEMPRPEARAFRNLIIDVYRQAVSNVVPFDRRDFASAATVAGMVSRFERWMRPDRVPMPVPPFEGFPKTRGPWEPI
jgi:hypothetical protein